MSIEAKRLQRAIGQYRHKVTLCRGRDFIKEQAIYIRKDIVFSARADIREIKGQFFQNGFAIDESRNAYSHNIFIRVAPQFDITGTAWIYEERFKTPSRWYKVLQVQDFNERGFEWRFLCRLVQKDDNAQVPVDARNIPLPAGLLL